MRFMVKSDNMKNDNDTDVKNNFIKLKSNYLCRIESNYIKKNYIINSC